MKYFCGTGAVGSTGAVEVQMGRIERNKRDAYHVRKHSRPTPRLAHVIFYLFFRSTSDSSSFAGSFLACLRFLKLFRVCRPLLEYLFCK